jgi:hypothetical protein
MLPAFHLHNYYINRKVKIGYSSSVIIFIYRHNRGKFKSELIKIIKWRTNGAQVCCNIKRPIPHLGSVVDFRGGNPFLVKYAQGKSAVIFGGIEISST